MIIALEKLTKRYGPITALDGVSLEVGPGAVGLLGPNGAGKSTLISLLLGQTQITSGAAFVLGLETRRGRLAIRQRTGYVPESDCFIPGLSGVGYVCYAGRLAGMDRQSAMRRAHEMLDLLELENERYRPVETYSAGMKQRVKLAQALVHDPELVFLDEPTNGMDPRGRRLVLGLLRELVKRGLSILLSSHLLPDVEQVCERVIVFGKGQVLADGLIEEMRTPSARRCTARIRGEVEPFAARLGDAGVRICNGVDERLELELPEDGRYDLVVQAAVRAGVQIHELRPQRSSLEQAFFEAIRRQRSTTGVAGNADSA